MPDWEGDPDRRTRSSEPSDEFLVAAVAADNGAAFEQLYDRYARLVYVLAARSLGGVAAEEVVQDVFLQLWRSAAQFDPARGSFAAWFTTIARHRVHYQLGQLSRERRNAALGNIDSLLEQLPDPGPTVADLSQRDEDARQALRALTLLPPEQRRAIALAYFGGLSQSAIAAHLGIPLGTVKKRVRLGMRKLRHALSESPQTAAPERESAAPRESQSWR